MKTKMLFLLAVAMNVTIAAYAAIEPASGWAESEPPIRFESREWADAVMEGATNNVAIAIEGGRLLSNATWTSDKTHLVFNTVYVPSGVTLTITAGAVVKYCPGTMIKVEDGGKLVVNGASGNDAILTAASDDTVGEAIEGFAEGQSMSFGGIRLQSSSATFTDNCYLETRGFSYSAFPSITVNNTEAVRNGGMAYVPFTLSGSSRDAAFSVEWEAVADTAVFGDDYTLASGRISWNKSSEGTKTLAIPLNSANITGEERTFKVRIKAAHCANIARREATVKIVERDGLTLEWADGWAESEPPIRFESREWAEPVLAAATNNESIAVEGGRLLSNATWTSDKTHLVFNTVYVPSGVTLTITAGAVVKYCHGTTIKVEDGGKLMVNGASGNDAILTAASDDTVGETIEGFAEGQSMSFGGIRLQSSAATFTDNGWLQTRGFSYSGYPGIYLNDSVAFRSAGVASIPVTLGGATRDQSFNVDWVAEDITARFGEDYTLSSGRISWNKSSDGTKTLSIPLVADHVVGSNTTFRLRLTVSRGANISRGQCMVTIRELDTLEIDAGAGESAPIHFESREWADAVMEGATNNAAIAIEGGRLQSNTTWGADKTHLVFNTVYVPSGVTLTITAGAVVKYCPGTMIKVEDGGKLVVNGASGNDAILTAASDDTVGETIEGFAEGQSMSFGGIRLQSSSATFSDNGWLQTRGFSYSGYPTLTIQDAIANRKSGKVYLSVTLGGSTRNQSFTADWIAEDATAQFGRDYTLASGRLTWSKSGDGTKYVAIPLATDETAGSNRTFRVRLATVRGANTARAAATATIAEYENGGIADLNVDESSPSEPSPEFAVNEGVGRQPIFLNPVERVQYSGKWQPYDENEAAVLRVTLETDNGATVLKETSPSETGAFDLDLKQYPVGYYTLKHEILNDLGETLATMQKTFSIADDEDVVLHGGVLASNEVWAADKVHVVYETVVVPSIYTIFIEPGAIVKFMTGTGIDISQGGAFFANRIVFTHINDDTVGGDTLNDGFTVAPPMDAYYLAGAFTFGDDTELRGITQNNALTGTIATQKTLSRGSTYRVSGTLTIASGGSLTIPPGTVLKMEDKAAIVVNSGATMNAVGTRAAPITFTSIKDDTISGDTNGDGSNTIPQPGDWEEIKNNGGTMNLAFVTALYGGYGQYSNQDDAIIRTANGETKMDCCVVKHSNLRLVGRTGGTVYAENCILEDGRWGIDGAVTFVNGVIANCNTGANGATLKNSILWVCDTYASGGTATNCVAYGEIATVQTGMTYADPLFVDPANGDFRVKEGSPCVDAADGAVAPELDFYGQPRITITDHGDELVGQLADIGICEVMPRDVVSDIDLVPQSVRTTTNAVPGQLLFVKWEIANVGGREVDAAWRDTVSLVSESGREVVLGVKTTSSRIGVGGSVFCSGYFTVPAIAEGTWYPKVNVNSYHDIFEGSLAANNALTGERAVSVGLVALDPSISREGEINGGTPTVLKLAYGEDAENRMVKFDVPAGVKATWGFGFMPGGTRSGASGSMTASGDGVMFRVPDGATDVYVVLESDTTTTYNLSTESTQMTITSVTPTTLPSSGTTTLTITGAGFGETNALSLISPVGRVALNAPQKDASGNLIATVDCATLTAGQTYAVRVESGENAAELPGAVVVMKSISPGKIEAKLDLPKSIRQGRVVVGYIEYGNIGGSDAAAPIFTLRGKSSGVSFVNDYADGQMVETLQLVGLGSSYPKGILRSGEWCRLPFKFKAIGQSYEISLSMLDATSSLPRDSVYATWRDFSDAISDAATRINGADGTICDYASISENAMRKGYNQDVDCIAGVLINVVSDIPMPGQVLQLVDSEEALYAETTTGSDGSFRFENLPADSKFRIGATTCQANMSGIVSGTLASKSLALYGADFATVECTVNGDAQSVALIDSQTGKIHNMEMTKDNTWKVGGIVDGDYTIEALFDDFRCVTNTVAVGVDLGMVTNGTLCLIPIVGGRVNLSLIDETGSLVDGVRGEFVSVTLGYSVGFTSDGNGCVTATLPAGNYTVLLPGGYSLASEVDFAVVKGSEVNASAVVGRNPVVVFPSCGPVPHMTEFMLCETNGLDNIVSCRWDFDSDGSWDDQGFCVTNIYTATGEYFAKCLVKFADGTQKEYPAGGKIEVWERAGYEPAEGTLTIDEKSGYEVISRADEYIVLEMSGDSWPIYIKEGDILIDPANLAKPRRVLEVLAADQFTLKIKTEFVPMESAYSSARLVFADRNTRNRLMSSGISKNINLDVDDGRTIGLGGSIKLGEGYGSASLDMSAGYTFHWVIKIQDGELKRFEHRSGFGGQITLSGGISSDKDKSMKERYRLSRPRGRPKKHAILDKIYPVGYVPVRVVARIVSEIGMEGSFSANVNCSVTSSYYDGKGWSTHYSKGFSIDDIELTGALYAKAGFEVEAGVGVGKDSKGVSYSFTAADLSVEAGGKLAFEVKLHGETQPDEYEFWAGPYVKGSINILHLVVGKWADMSFIRVPFDENVWKIYSRYWATPIPDFSVGTQQLSENTVKFTLSSTTQAGDSIWAERNWKCGGVDFGSDKTVEPTFGCKTDDWCSYDMILRERYMGLLFGINFDFTRSKIRRKTIKFKAKKDGEPEIEIDDEGGNVPQSCDPNEMRGKIGLGDPETQRFVKPGEELTYTIYFENKTNATAAAQEVYVTNPLSEWLDWSTFKMHEVAFGDQIDLGLAGLNGGTSEVTMKGTNFVVRTELVLEENGDAGTRDACPYQAKWYMRIVDPTTDTGWPTDIVAGFLPPNDETHRGEGHITYSICVREDAPANLVISNSADIVFDHNPSIKTDPAWWNTVAPMTGNAKFNETVVETEEGSNAVIRVTGGNLYTASSVKVYLTYNTAAAADLDLAKGEIDGETPKGGLKFPLTLTWAKGEIGEKVITIPVKTDKTVEGDEFFTLQLATPNGLTLGDATVCTVTIVDQNDKTIKASVTPYKPKKDETVATNSITVASGDAKGGFVAGTGEYTSGSKLTLTAESRSGWAFKGWRLKDGDETILSDKAKWQVVVTNDEDYVAVFEKIPYVRGLADPADGGKVAGSGLCDKGKKVTLKATTNKNFTFLGWRQGTGNGFVATTASLVIDRTAKPTANSKTSTTITNIAEDVTYYAVFKSYPEVFVTVDATDGDGSEPTGKGAGKYVAGTITGMGKYAPGKTKIGLKATANKGYVFSGWYDAYGELLTKDAAYTIAAMGEDDVEYTAKFITAAEDKASIALGVNGAALSSASGDSPTSTNIWAGVYLEWPVAASALSETKVKVAGLPSGLKFTDKPVTSKIGSGKTAVTVTNVPANTIYGAPTAASKIDTKTGAAKPSVVKFTVTTAGKSTQTYQIALTVDALPTWAQGTFAGGMTDGGQVSLTVSAAGKTSGKALGDGLTYTLAAPYYAGFEMTDGVSNFLADVTATWSYKEGTKTIKTNEVVKLVVQDNGVGGYAAVDGWLEAYTVNWKVEPWKTLGKTFDKATMAYAIMKSGEISGSEEDVAAPLGEDVTGRVTLKFSATGSATIAGEFVTEYNATTKKAKTVKVTGSANIVPVDNEHGVVFIYLTPKGLAPHAYCMPVAWPEEL